MQNNTKTALILGGGGARAAYQVGVLMAISKIIEDKETNPFPIICGTSAGSINAVALASGSDNFTLAVQKIASIWQNFELSHVFKVDSVNLFKRILLWFWRQFGFGDTNKGPHSILDNQPLSDLLSKHIPFYKIDTALENNHIEACCVTACNYHNGMSTSFFTSNKTIKRWQKNHKQSIATKLELKHLLASSAIPALFPAIKIEQDYYGDGSMRQTAPISPAIHLGANKIFIIGLKMEENKRKKKVIHPPTLGQTAGFILDTLFLNNLRSDIQNMEGLNQLSKDTQDTAVKHIDHLLINPSEDIADIALKHFSQLPRGFKTALHFLGMNKENSRRFISYLMFTKNFCNELVELGYQDAMKEKKAIKQFLS